jgi:hypothetical protein
MRLLPHPGVGGGLADGSGPHPPRSARRPDGAREPLARVLPCNAHKGDRITAFDPKTATLVRLFNPRRQVWTEHFAWTAERDRIVGTTPFGRATVVALDLNRAPLVLSRREWVRVGWHPPGNLRTSPRQ